MREGYTHSSSLAEEKLEGPATIIIFLGILLDSGRLEARLPQEKLEELLQAVDDWLAHSSGTIRGLVSLIGVLSFAAKVVPAGRTFIRQMLDLCEGHTNLDAILELDQEFKLLRWKHFAAAWNGASFFLLPNWTPAPDVELFTDSAGTIGFGAFFQGSWFNGRWSPAQLSHSIQWKEFYPIVMAALVWGS